MYQAERGLFDLQRGRLVCVAADSGPERSPRALLAAVEGLTLHGLNMLRGVGNGAVWLTVTDHRARALGLLSQHPFSRKGVSLPLPQEMTPEKVLEIACAVTCPLPPSATETRRATEVEAGGLEIARFARLLPAVISVRVESANSKIDELIATGEVLSVCTADITAMTENEHLEVTHVSEGPVPLVDAEDAQFMSFREASGMLEHIAILTGDRSNWSDPIPVRIHSACLTGDLFGSLRCDCGEQLRSSLRILSAGGGGVLIYLFQEGRGIGFGNKLRAYSLQQQGLDTVDADCTLGFGADERRYDAAVAILRHLEVERVQLLTNNPEKVRAMREAGIEVIDRQPLYGTLNRHNVRYVRAKVQRAGHWLGEMLARAVPGK